jgi:chromate transporter
MKTPSLAEATALWAKIGILSFGGPAAQISLMHRFVVEEKGWLSERQYLNALSFCMLLPGPEAMQLATYVGWRLHGVLGGLIAGLLFVMPGALIVLAFAVLYAVYGDMPVLQSVFIGVKAAVLVIVLEALSRVAKRSLISKIHWAIAAMAFVALFFFNISFPLVLMTAGLFGFVFLNSQNPDQQAFRVSVSPWQSISTVVIWSSLWVMPIVAIQALTNNSILVDLGVFFSKLATVTFGGAYAVLSYMAQDAVLNKGWLTAAEMLDGLGLAETTPGPLILVTEFVGFLAGARAEGEGLNIGLGLSAAFVTLWVTFVPCFLWVFTGAPYIEWMASKQRLSNALLAISAAVVGVILNLSLWFGLHVLFQDVVKWEFGIMDFWLPNVMTLDLQIAFMTVVAAYLLLRRHHSVVLTLLICGFLGWAIPYMSSVF